MKRGEKGANGESEGRDLHSEKNEKSAPIGGWGVGNRHRIRQRKREVCAPTRRAGSTYEAIT